MHTYIADGAGQLIGPVFFPITPGFGEQLPSNATQLAAILSKPGTGKVWALVDGQPRQLADHRGTVYRTDTGSEAEHAALGELPEGLTSLPRPSENHQWHNGRWVEVLDELYANKVAEINWGCETAITDGFSSSALGSPHLYSSQMDDQLNLTGAVVRGREILYACRDASGVKDYRPHTTEQIFQVGDDFTLFKQQLLLQANTLKQLLSQALAAGDRAALEAVKWERPQS
ncbi:hypothetical protein M5G22_13490 [Pseudomonas sp. TNT2022 ID233]|uniref:hypothetical protein n=1 Tax=Pseudomonas aphyarum TaxID=2942629 RepID=UPI00235FF77F|nr:hypothetical protein [Pseudomonas aphyarum]MDD1138561.1 hypothetical protein [Pseudomonas aphyarum]